MPRPNSWTTWSIFGFFKETNLTDSAAMKVRSLKTAVRFAESERENAIYPELKRIRGEFDSLMSNYKRLPLLFASWGSFLRNESTGEGDYRWV